MRNVSHTRQESPGFSRGEEVNKPAGCFLCGSTMGLVPSMYGPVCMECVLSDKQVGPNRASLLFTLFGDGRGRKIPA